MKKAVITADLVQSSKLSLEDREWALEKIQNKLDTLYLQPSEMQSEIYRGDSFQCQLKPRLGLRTALMLKTYIKSLDSSKLDTKSATNNLKIKKLRIDVRMSVAIGEVIYGSNKLGLSDGKAFQLSGRRLDELKKEKMTFAITTDDAYNDELNISGIMLDSILDKTTTAQCQVLYMKLEG
ncbi:MAG: hypothetical protein K2Q22_03215, partial [Cytophagales bacterium]|nr:hypothetical protein [Cytophagales bacterium]